MPKFEAKIIGTGEITHDTRKIRAELPKEADFRPGQFFTVVIGEGLAHSLSAACAPGKGFVEFAKKDTGSDFSKKFFSLREGDKITLLGPAGVFVLDESRENIAFLSGGIGITPLRSMLQHAAEKGVKARITFIYSNKTPEDIAFREELDKTASENENIKVVHCITRPEESKEGWKGPTGHISAEMVRENVPNHEKAVYYICGPPKMVGAMKSVLEKMGLPEEQIKSENFSGY